jgi:hypothetical protein
MPRELAKKELSPEELLTLELEMHAGFKNWTYDHMAEPGSSITYKGYSPHDNPEQGIAEFVTEARLPYRVDMWLPDKLVLAATREIILAKALGGRSLARQLVSDFKHVSDDVSDLLDNGKNIATVMAHKYRPDIGIGPGGLASAQGSLKYIFENNWQIINKLMTVQDYQGKSLVGKTRTVGRIAYVIPPGKSMDVYNIPRKASLIVNRGSSEALNTALDDPDTGVNVSVAPTGAGMIPVRDEQGNITGWKFPNIDGSAQTMLEPMDAVLPFAMDKDPETGKAKWKVGNLILPPNKPELSTKNNSKLYMDMIMLNLTLSMEEILDKPVEYNPLILVGAGTIAVKSVTSP